MVVRELEMITGVIMELNTNSTQIIFHLVTALIAHFKQQEMSKYKVIRN